MLAAGEEQMSEKVTGYIDHVIFRNDENGYTVMVLKTADSEEELTCEGTFPDVTQGVTIEAEGQFSQHHVYGRQFVIHSYAEKAPEDTQAMERYLGSGAIKGVGVALAARIVRYFGEDTLRIVEEEPERLAEVKGISEKKAREIAAQVTEKADMRKAMMFLQKYGISLNLGAKIYQKYGQSVYGVLQENPYRLADDISGVGFKIADAIASRIGIHADSDYRIRSGMMYTLIQASGEGHVYLPKEELFARASQLLRVDVSYMEKHLMDMALDRKLVLKEKDGIVLVYPSQYYHLELNTARMLTELNIRYPQDVSLLNEARENAETLLDVLHDPADGKKPRTYRKRARKDYLKYTRCRKHTAKMTRKAIGKQLAYLRRDLDAIDGKLSLGKNLPPRQAERLGTIRAVYEQQKYMYDNRTHSVPDRIVSVSQPFVRPIVRGKAGKPVEFGAKLDISVVDGWTRLECCSFDAYNEAGNLREMAERFRAREGHYPSRILAYKGFRRAPGWRPPYPR